MKCDILPHLYRWWRMSLLQQDSRGHLTFMAVNREIPKYLDATLWNRGFVDANGKYYELWNAQAQYYTEYNFGNLSAEAIHREIDGTLKRLGTDYLDLYIIHCFDYETPIEETVEALNV